MTTTVRRPRSRRLTALLSIAAASAAILSLTTLSSGPATAATATVAPSPANCENEVVAAKPGGGAWTCTFDDEFTGTALNTAVWTPQQTATSGYVTGAAPYEACYTNSAADVNVSGGYLNLSAVKLAKPATCSDGANTFTSSYTAGSVSSAGNFTQTYGRFEAKAELPNVSVAGLQETLWLYPANGTKYGKWPASGEIDYAEFYSGYSGNTVPYIHYNPTTAKNWSNDTNVLTQNVGNVEPGKTCTYTPAAFNTYVVTWAPNLITLYVNGQTCVIDNYAATQGSTAPFDQPFFLSLTQALGVNNGLSTNGTTASTPMGTTHVDYVRVWK